MHSDVSDAYRHLDSALRFLEEGKALVDKDPVQASEKLYKAAEECVKALAIHYNLSDILEVVEKRGRWTVTELDKVEEVANAIWKQCYIHNACSSDAVFNESGLRYLDKAFEIATQNSIPVYDVLYIAQAVTQ
jgi:predicted nucleic acid-binding protein